MAKPEWGAKRACHSCGARFYDLGRDTIVCPVCNTVYDPERQQRTRRGGSVVKEGSVAVSRVAEAALKKRAAESETVGDKIDGKIGGNTDGNTDGDAATATKATEEKADEGDMDEIKAEDRDLIEDTSDLGEDDDDIGEVMEHVDEDVEDKT